MDAFRLAAEMRHYNLNKVQTTADIHVCKMADLPEDMDKDKHLDSGICVMMHTTSGTIMEVRGIDETGQEFSYRFHMEKGPKQPVAMRAVGMSGTVQKLKVSLAEESSDIRITQN